MRSIHAIAAFCLLFVACSAPQQEEKSAAPPTHHGPRPVTIRSKDRKSDRGTSRYSADFIATEENTAIDNIAFGAPVRIAQAALNAMQAADSNTREWPNGEVEAVYHKDELAAVRLKGFRKYPIAGGTAAARAEADRLFGLMKERYGEPAWTNPYPDQPWSVAYAYLYVWEIGRKDVAIYLDRDETDFWVTWEAQATDIIARMMVE